MKVTMLFPQTIDRETIGDFLFTLDGHNFEPISKSVQPKLIEQSVSSFDTYDTESALQPIAAAWYFQLVIIIFVGFAKSYSIK